MILKSRTIIWFSRSFWVLALFFFFNLWKLLEFSLFHILLCHCGTSPCEVTSPVQHSPSSHSESLPFFCASVEGNFYFRPPELSTCHLAVLFWCLLGRFLVPGLLSFMVFRCIHLSFVVHPLSALFQLYLVTRYSNWFLFIFASHLIF